MMMMDDDAIAANSVLRLCAMYKLTLGANDGKWLGGANGVAPGRPGCRRPGAV